MASMVVVIGLRTRQCECYEFAIALNGIEIEIIVGRDGISNLTPWGDHRFLLLLLAGAESEGDDKRYSEFHPLELISSIQ